MTEIPGGAPEPPQPRRAATARGVSSGLAGSLVGLGGLLTALGSVLTWVNAEIDLSSTGGPIRTETVGGLETDDGKIAIGLGVALVVFGVAIAALRSRTGRRILGVLSLLVGAVAVVLGVVDLATLEDEGIRSLAEDVVAQTGITTEQAETELRRIVSLSGGIGLYLVVLGGAAAFLGGVLGLFPRTPPGEGRPVPEPPLGPGGMPEEPLPGVEGEDDEEPPPPTTRRPPAPPPPG